MKKFLLLTVLTIFIGTQLHAQPQIMNYQGVARNSSGLVIANQQIALKISILESSSSGPVVYTETHEVTTSQFGVFSLKIGTGTPLLSSMDQVNWAGSDHYIQVEMDATGGDNYQLMGTSQLLSVPYAFHALTAGSIEGSLSDELKAGKVGIPSQTWSLFGNSDSDPTKDKMGTTDYTDLVFVTDNMERLRITADGQLITPDGVGLQLGGNLRVQGDSTTIEKDLYVGRNVYLNTSDEFTPPGQTINYGNFTVAKMSSTLLTGDLTVDGETNLNSALSVNNSSPTLLSGTLTVQGNGVFNQYLTLDNPSLGSSDPTSGALVVAGGVGIGENLNVGGNSQIDGQLHVADNTSSTSPTTGALTVVGGAGINENLNVGGEAKFGGPLHISDATSSTSPTTGALTVVGGTGINENLNVNGNTAIGGTLGVTGATTLNSTLGVTGATTLSSTLNVTGNSTVNRLNANGQVTISTSLATPEDNYANYPLQVEGSQQGIAVKLTPTDPGRSNNFMSFWGSDGSAKGRIEGMQGLTGITRSIVNSLVSKPDSASASDQSDSKNQAAPAVTPNQYFNNDYAYDAYSLTIDFVMSIVTFGTNLAAASGLCIVGDCDDVIWSALEMTIAGIQLGGYIAYNETNLGVAFESGGADYAEWLMKSNADEAFTFGDVVGVKGGLISKEFKTAEKFMVISKDPTVIGAMPEADKEKFYEKIAFMGQVPVKVIGKVKKGDYILPSGNQDGMAIAVAPNQMATLDYSRIIGTAWGESDGKKLFEYVNTAVGINSNDMAGVISNMQSLLNEMQIALNSVVPDYQPQLYAVAGASSNLPSGQYTKSQSLTELFEQNSDALQYNSMEEALSKVQEYAGVQDFDFSEYPYLAEIFENPSPELAEEMVTYYTQVLNRLNEMMASINQP
ncbi:hypothetical protein SLH46_19705 [Draconibacterium sp. IB214405]|uniref:hypothetical protein n=1 Tax=Draconibacterium sp. IB214405 TaxID=3097352 RepID=UPI002A142FE8|nr:hypothetical protein [Draconibacterium sp. IB214405]MDX8341434.1 hypothetical protein [Draconibacterium sp. IB214405]